MIKLIDMRLNIVVSLFTVLFSNVLFAQQIKFEGTHAPDSAVLKLLEEYATIFEKYKNVAERDAVRKSILSAGYFYHGMDGAPIGLTGLTNRQTKNNFKLIADSVYDEILYQYENTAILVFKEWQHLIDKGVEKQGINSVIIVMGKEDKQWKILSDIIGQKPANIASSNLNSKQ